MECYLCHKEIRKGEDYFILDLNVFYYDVWIHVHGYRKITEVYYIHKECLEKVKNEKV